MKNAVTQTRVSCDFWVHYTLPPNLLQAWQEIGRVRNRGSHARPLPRSDYEQVLTLALDTTMLDLLVRLKRGMSSLAETLGVGEPPLLVSSGASVQLTASARSKPDLAKQVGALPQDKIKGQIGQFVDRWRSIKTNDARQAHALAHAILEKLEELNEPKWTEHRSWVKEVQAYLAQDKGLGDQYVDPLDS